MLSYTKYKYLDGIVSVETSVELDIILSDYDLTSILFLGKTAE